MPQGGQISRTGIPPVYQRTDDDLILDCLVPVEEDEEEDEVPFDEEVEEASETSDDDWLSAL